MKIDSCRIMSQMLKISNLKFNELQFYKNLNPEIFFFPQKNKFHFLLKVLRQAFRHIGNT